MRARPRAWPLRISATVSRSSPAVFSVASESSAPGTFTACSVPAFSSAATSRSTSPIATAPGAWASAAANRSVRENTASRSERCARAQATASAAGDCGVASGTVSRSGARPSSRTGGRSCEGLSIAAVLRSRASPVSGSSGASASGVLSDRVAGSTDASRRARPGSFHGPRHQRAGGQSDIGGMALPHTAELVAVDVALRGPRHQRGALRDARIVRGCAEPALFHRRLDLRAPARERLDLFPRYPRDLEAPVGMGLLDPVAEPAETGRELVAVEHADQLLLRIQPLVGHRAPLAVLPLHHVGDYRVGVELRIEVPRRVVAEGGRDDLLPADPCHLPGIGLLHAGFGGVLLDPGQRRRHRAVVRLDDALVATDQRGDGDRLGRREGEGRGRDDGESRHPCRGDRGVSRTRPAPCLRAPPGRYPRRPAPSGRALRRLSLPTRWRRGVRDRPSHNSRRARSRTRPGPPRRARRSTACQAQSETRSASGPAASLSCVE